MQVTELRFDAELEAAFPAIQDLHHDPDERRLRELIPEVRAAGYRMFALREGDAIVAGVQMLTDLCYGRHLYVYELSVTRDARPRGYGGRLLRHVAKTAREEGRGSIALARGLERDAALRFYRDRMGHEWPGYAVREALPA